MLASVPSNDVGCCYIYSSEFLGNGIYFYVLAGGWMELLVSELAPSCVVDIIRKLCLVIVVVAGWLPILANGRSVQAL